MGRRDPPVPIIAATEGSAADRFARSRAWHERASRVLAAGVSSQFRAFGVFHPMHYVRAEGARMWDADGNELLDYTLAQGPCILGHSHPELVSRVQAAVARAQLFAGQHEEEVLLAEALQRLIPCAELLRFASSGSEAAQACIRLARAVTGRQRILKFDGHYHGWLDSVAFNVAPPGNAAGDAPVPWCAGIAESAAADVICLPWNDLDAVRRTMARHGDEIAAIITEPVMCNQGCIEPLPGFLAGLREICDAHGSALIFDEIITGFRIALGGAQAQYGVTPDLALFGKALGAGFPLAAVAGRARWMAPLQAGTTYHAGTMNGNNACVAAGLATVELLERDDHAALRRIARLGAALRDGLAERGTAHGLALRVQGPGPMFHMAFSCLPRATEYRHVAADDRAAYQSFCRGMLLEGVRLIERGLWYVSAAHTEADVAATLAAADRVLAAIAAGRGT
ncbi:aspartate aminotransferase family protein [Falsiroseomonas oryzae]|uniref:aspartate aminotransferase family protein n=1 Tax=Falsiroseomonas oryzae TaxID=2766473 RepID=UPI0022EA3D48|nr:aspartate aminotransferase family protein [Roseomonas sp. MO-31]